MSVFNSAEASSSVNNFDSNMPNMYVNSMLPTNKSNHYDLEKTTVNDHDETEFFITSVEHAEEPKKSNKCSAPLLALGLVFVFAAVGLAIWGVLHYSVSNENMALNSSNLKAGDDDSNSENDTSATASITSQNQNVKVMTYWANPDLTSYSNNQDEGCTSESIASWTIGGYFISNVLCAIGSSATFGCPMCECKVKGGNVHDWCCTTNGWLVTFYTWVANIFTCNLASLNICTMNLCGKPIFNGVFVLGKPISFSYLFCCRS